MALTFFNIAVCAEIVALMAALLCLSNKGVGYLRLFILFLIVTILIEGLGYYMEIEKKDNSIVYNAFMILQIGFYGYLFFQFQKSKINKLAILIFSGLFILFYIIEAFIKAKSSFLFTTYQNQSRLLLSIYVVLFCCTFFFSILKNDSIKNPLKLPSFWIATGLFFYYFGSIVVFAFRDYIKELRLSGNTLIYELITGSLSVILYGSWVIGFIWQKKQQQSSKL